MSNRFERECAWNVSTDILKRIEDRTDWRLFLCDCYWVLDMDGNCEFYFHPLHFISKIDKAQLPNIVIQRIRRQCKCFTAANRLYWDIRGYSEPSSLQSSSYRLEALDKTMTIGNWFYAQGEAYVTVNGKFICNDPYVDELERECDLNDINWCVVEDMLCMTSSTRTHYYMRSLFDLPCFQGIKCTGIMQKPLRDIEWDSKGWAIAYQEESGDKVTLRFMRKEVFQHTVFLVRQGCYYTESGRKILFRDSRPMIKNSVFYTHKISLRSHPTYEQSEICVENMDCLTAAKKLLEEGYNPAVLNMANRQKPGGGVYNGAGAQEENLFRRTNLFQSMYQFSPYAREYSLPTSPYQYPLDRNYGGVYTPDVVVFRGEEKDGYPLLNEYYQIGVISVPGMNRPRLEPDGSVAPNLIEGIKNKIRTILNIGVLHHHDSLVLGALGCGAFRNPPAHIARLFHEVIEQEFKNHFCKICFAIMEDHNSGGKAHPKGNYLPFYREFHTERL